MDRLLDRAESGPRFLQQPEIAQLVETAVQDGEARFQRYRLHAFVVMPNHVHLLVTPNVASTQWLGPLKGFTGLQANRILGVQETAFWQDESYDHLVRTQLEFERVRAYIERNPVSAGLVASAEQFRWSSAWGTEPPERRLQPGMAAPPTEQC
jgi:REP element-mobilizing transposase RayT